VGVEEPLIALFALLLLGGYGVIGVMKQSFLGDVWIVLALLIALLGSSNPWIATTQHQHKEIRHELFIALDLSGSMQADDLKPNRFVFAKERLKALIDEGQSWHMGLLGFSGGALPLMPLSGDRALLKEAIDLIDLGNISAKSTHFTPLIKQVARMSDAPNKHLLILSDGGDEKHFKALYKALKAHHVQLHLWVMSTDKGAPLYDQYHTLIRDASGRMVISHTNHHFEAFVNELGGVVRGPYADPKALLLDLKDAIEGRNITQTELQKPERESLMKWCAALALVLLLWSRFGRSIRGVWGVLVIVVLMTPERSYADSGDYVYWLLIQLSADKQQCEYYEALYVRRGDVRIGYNAANCYARIKHYPEARQLLMGLRSTDREMMQKITYNLGNISAYMGMNEAAIEHYLDALLLGYDADADHNRELLKKQKALRQLERQSSHEMGGERGEKAIESEMKEASGSESGGALNQKKSTQKQGSGGRALGYKAYRLINEGGSNEAHPW